MVQVKIMNYFKKPALKPCTREGEKGTWYRLRAAAATAEAVKYLPYLLLSQNINTFWLIQNGSLLHSYWVLRDRDLPKEQSRLC